MKAAEEKVKTSIYLPESLYWKLKETAVAMRLKDTEAMEIAVRRWVQNPDEAEASPTPSDDDADLARRFLHWFRKTSQSPTHKGLVDLMAFELKREK